MIINAAQGETTGFLTTAVTCHVQFGSIVILPSGERWFEVTIPVGTPAGEYTGYLGIEKIAVNVYSFSMPEVPIPFYVGLSPNRIINSDEATCRKVLKDHGVEVQYLPRPKYDSATGQCKITSEYIDIIEALPKRTVYFLTCPYRFDKWNLLQAYLHSYGVFLQSINFTSDVAVYLIDEPKTPDDANRLYDFLHDTNNPILSIIPGSAQNLAPCRVDIPVYFWGREYPTDKRHWVYTALDNRGKAPTWLANSPAADFLAPFFCGAEGFWYWTAVLDFDYTIGDLKFPGEGKWIINGQPTRQLKLVREGINCWHYLKMMKDPDLAKRIAAVVTPSFSVWVKNVATIYEIKNLISGGVA